ncbi:Uncharacterized protein FKW44_015295 [Caligus rogercresseyi]|uniref:Uncharacterized protein n=1 Tax=Caligus rogercresseyi TaxID=217165 RepID=A0A7T8JZM5_CALRO|nr:Uncharacterized protein FKW44_015295 [Caligus rogercresseyi]
MNSKSLICHKLTSYKPLHPQELRSIFISAAARYAALSLKIPSPDEGGTWTSAGR